MHRTISRRWTSAVRRPKKGGGEPHRLVDSYLAKLKVRLAGAGVALGDTATLNVKSAVPAAKIVAGAGSVMVMSVDEDVNDGVTRILAEPELAMVITTVPLWPGETLPVHDTVSPVPVQVSVVSVPVAVTNASGSPMVSVVVTVTAVNA